MPSQPPDPGGEWLKQFRKVEVAAGPLKGARFTEVSWEDLKKAAKSYKQDARFNQFAKRMLSERALGPGKGPEDAAPQVPKSWRSRASEWLIWIFSKSKGRVFLACCVVSLLCLLLSRPLFYVLVARGLAISIRLALRRSFGLIVIILDAILDEAAASLEASLITAPVPGVPTNNLEIQQQHSFTTLLLHGFFALIGAWIGRQMPRAQVPVRRLRVV
jgi:hypothetical protein